LGFAGQIGINIFVDQISQQDGQRGHIGSPFFENKLRM
jgi:hypothetical protein